MTEQEMWNEFFAEWDKFLSKDKSLKRRINVATRRKASMNGIICHRKGRLK